MLRLFAEDVRQKAVWCYGSSTWKAVLQTLLTDGTAAMFWYRAMQCSQRWRLAPLAMIFNKVNAICCQCIIGRNADFGPGFVLIHSQGVVINSNVKGGRQIFIEHQVTIGAEKGQTPLLADHIFIGAGAKIIGPVKIGKSARIGANAVVIRDVPDGATVGGIPAKVLRIRDVETGEVLESPSEADSANVGASV